MLDGVMRRLLNPGLNRAGRALAGLGVTADMVTAFGLLAGLGAAGMIALGWFGWALALIALSRAADGLDGAVARATRVTDFGGYFDITADFLFYGAVPLGFVLADPAANGAAGAMLLCAFYFNGATFLGFAILAEKHAMRTESRGVKSLYYTAGLLEGTETIAFFALLCLAPQWFAPLALGFAALTFLTAFARLAHARRVFSGAD